MNIKFQELIFLLLLFIFFCYVLKYFLIFLEYTLNIKWINNFKKIIIISFVIYIFLITITLLTREQRNSKKIEFKKYS